jgi:spore coat protein U-like protein
VVFTLNNPNVQNKLTFRVVNAATGAAISLSGAPGNESQVLSGDFPTGTAANSKIVFQYAFQVDPADLPAPGTYTARISQKLYGGSTFPPSGAALDTNTLTVSITVGSHYDVSVVGSGAGFSLASTNQVLNFGILAAGGQVAADILVRSNVTYSLSLTSANGGRLVNVADSTSAVAYSVTANGTPVPLTPPPGEVAGGAAATFETPMRYSLLFTILPISDFPSAGTYSDTIIVNLAAP